VLDVRFASEYDAGHVPGAVNASYTRLPEYMDRLPADVTLLVHCQSGARAAVAASYLQGRGRRVKYVNDQWATWASTSGVERRTGVARAGRVARTDGKVVNT
jgi:hydroxyacylglutathione hydrolase